MGGGFGVSHRDVVCDDRLLEDQSRESVPTLDEYLKEVLPHCRSLGCMVLCEPGRSIVANSGALIVRVLYRKEAGERKFVVVDGGMNDLIRPTLYNAYHQIVPIRLNAREHETVDVVGPICESGDFFALERFLPRAVRGELLAILSAGAYGFVFSSNYNGRPRAAEHPPRRLPDDPRPARVPAEFALDARDRWDFMEFRTVHAPGRYK